MGLLIIAAMLALSSWCVVATFRRLRRMHASRMWWFALSALIVSGLIAGYWLAFSFEYQVSPRLRLVSFPMPITAFHLEENEWIDFVPPRHVMYPALLANVLTVVAFTLFPLWLALFAHAKRRKPRETQVA